MCRTNRPCARSSIGRIRSGRNSSRLIRSVVDVTDAAPARPATTKKPRRAEALGGLGAAFLSGRCVECRAPGRPLCAPCVSSGTSPTGRTPAGRFAGVAAGPYDGPFGTAIRAAKYGGTVNDLADVFAALLSDVFAELFVTVPAEIPVVGRFGATRPSGGTRLPALVPVPTDPRRRRRRGHDLVRAVVSSLSARTGLPVDDCVVCAAGRRAHAGASGRRRRRPDPYRFQLRRAPASNVIVIDDVMTTGSTIAAVCGVLAAGGAVASACAIASA